VIPIMIAARATTPATTASHGKSSPEVVAVVAGAVVVVGVALAVVTVLVLGGVVVGGTVVDVTGTVVGVVDGAGVVVVCPEAAPACTKPATTTRTVAVPWSQRARRIGMRAP
jgi:hypothetical protein